MKLLPFCCINDPHRHHRCSHSNSKSYDYFFLRHATSYTRDLKIHTDNSWSHWKLNDFPFSLIKSNLAAVAWFITHKIRRKMDDSHSPKRRHGIEKKKVNWELHKAIVLSLFSRVCSQRLLLNKMWWVVSVFICCTTKHFYCVHFCTYMFLVNLKKKN